MASVRDHILSGEKHLDGFETLQICCKVPFVLVSWWVSPKFVFWRWPNIRFNTLGGDSRMGAKKSRNTTSDMEPRTLCSAWPTRSLVARKGKHVYGLLVRYRFHECSCIYLELCSLREKAPVMLVLVLYLSVYGRLLHKFAECSFCSQQYSMHEKLFELPGIWLTLF